MMTVAAFVLVLVLFAIVVTWATNDDDTSRKR